ncbi:lytic transglycosylase domain-containing protein [Panacagrimonas perspica]|nr:lytic transglycosylase domain-containing protein [Panacagrimonas perspica]
MMAVTQWLSRLCVAATCLGGMTAKADETSTNAALDAGIRTAQSGAILAADPAVAPAPVPPVRRPDLAKADADDILFPRYPILAPNVAFWTKVFSEYSENQSAIHDMNNLDMVFEVLDFTSEAAYMDPGSLRRLKNAEEAAALTRTRKLLEEVHEARYQPETLNVEQRRIFDLFSKNTDDARFANAAKALRSQRGLRERTQMALETSGNYLPAMEGVFQSYSLPLRLTRLPLVESSFNVEAYSKVGAAGLWQFIPSSARIYMRLNDVVDDRRDPWTSTDGAARHLRDDYAALGAWPLALTAYNHGRGGIARGLSQTGGTELPDLIRGYNAKSFGFASRNFYAEFLAASDVERNWRKHFGEIQRKTPLEFDVVETQHYVPYETLRRLCNADDEVFRKLNPAYRPEVIAGKLYVPPGHLIRVPAGAAQNFTVGYAQLGDHERFDQQRVNYLLHKVKRGDTLSKIASRYGVTQASIRNNNRVGKKGVRAGQVLKIVPHSEARPGPVTVAVGESKPGLTRAEKHASDAVAKAVPKPSKAGYRTHKVRYGQTLTSIAHTYKVSLRDLRQANDMGSSSEIRVGDKLRVPVSR